MDLKFESSGSDRIRGKGKWHISCSLIEIAGTKTKNGEEKTIMSKIENKVVVRFRDGNMLKGYTYDFFPHKNVFHLTETRYSKDVTEVSKSLLKAVFFVKTFEGNKNHRGPEDFSLESLKNIHGLKIKVTFFDGEIMYGTTNGYAPNRKGFFVFPADKETNNERVFVIMESTSAVETWR
jgi:hypothetical protein